MPTSTPRKYRSALRKTILLGTLCSFSLSTAQDLGDLLIADVNDAKRFATDYLAPVFRSEYLQHC